MELRQLEYFMAVCKELHFTRAADKLGIAQPSLSQQIRLLEHEVGMPLFDRVGKRTAITEAGKTLLHHCYNIFHELTQARTAINELQGLSRGSLKVGALLTVVNYLLPPTVISFHRQYPNVELSVQGMRTGDIIERLLHNELDLGIVYLPIEQEDLETVPLCKVSLALAAPKNFPIANEPYIALNILKEIPSVLLPDSYYLRQLINKSCLKLQFTPQPVLEMTTMESIINMVVNGIGVTILPKEYLDHINNPLIQTIPILDTDLTVPIGIVYRKNKYLCAASRVFIEQLSAMIKK